MAKKPVHTCGRCGARCPKNVSVILKSRSDDLSIPEIDLCSVCAGKIADFLMRGRSMMAKLKKTFKRMEREVNAPERPIPSATPKVRA